MPPAEVAWFDQQLANLALLRGALLTLIPCHFPSLPLKQVFEHLHSHPAAGRRIIR